FASLLANRRLLVAGAIFAAIYVAFFTAFFNNWLGVVTGTTGSVLYWLAQHDVKRGGQPGYYYAVLLAVYEPLLLAWFVAALALIGRGLWRQRAARKAQNVKRKALAADDVAIHNGVAHSTENGADIGSSAFSLQPSAFAVPLVLLWWSLATVAIYSWAGEKMPWLLIHLVLPLTLLGAWACARALGWALNALTPQDQQAEAGTAPFILAQPLSLGLFAGVLAVIGMLSFLFGGVTSNQAGGGAVSGLVLLGILLLLVALLTVAAGLRYSWRWGVGALALGATLLLGAYTVRNSVRLSFLSGDTPREMLIYTQTSPDVMRVVRNLERASRVRHNNLSMPVIYDNETVWSWYMRRFTAATESGQVLSERPGPEVQAVLMLQENIDRSPANLEMLQGFHVQRLPLRWWLPEDDIYRLRADWRTAPVEQVSLLGRVLRDPLSGATAADLWQYLVYRNTKAPLGSSDFVIAVRPALAEEIGLGTGAARDQ
ncbi:MAG: TIGR03663 family protein, partial [Chloroflexales bacterium]|nr:TIGR03663 family protein [Chloroflexales bacterium]